MVSPPDSGGVGPGHDLCCVLGQQLNSHGISLHTEGENDTSNFCRKVQQRMFDQVSRHLKLG